MSDSNLIECAYSQCSAMFAPKEPKNRFHTTACADEDYNERRRARREAKKAARAATRTDEGMGGNAIIEMKKVRCARYSCDELFTPKSINHRFHSTDCAEAAKNEKKLLDHLTEEPDPAVVQAATNELVREGERQNRVLMRRLLKEETRTAITLQRIDEYFVDHPKPRFAIYQPRKMNQAGKGAPTDCHFLFSDPQGGKLDGGIGLEALLESYLPALAEKIIRCVEVQRYEGPVDTFFFHMLGDIIENCQIYAGQRNHLDRYRNGNSAVDQVLLMADAIADIFIARLRPYFKHFVLASAYGNHGRTGTKADPSLDHDNLDRLVAEIVKRMCSHMDVEWVIPERDRYVVKTMGYSVGGIHGHQLGSKTSLNSMELPLLRWDAIQHFGVQLDAMLIGHRHHPASLDVNGIEIIQNGALDGGSEYFTGATGAYASPSQELFFVSEEYFIGTRRRLYVAPRVPRSVATSRWAA